MVFCDDENKKRSGRRKKKENISPSLSLFPPHYQKKKRRRLLRLPGVLLTLSGLVGDLDVHLLGLVLLYEKMGELKRRKEEKKERLIEVSKKQKS